MRVAASYLITNKKLGKQKRSIQIVGAIDAEVLNNVHFNNLNALYNAIFSYKNLLCSHTTPRVIHTPF